MIHCCPHANSASKLFSFFAHSSRRRFSKKGFEPSQKQLMRGLKQLGYQQATVLEIGCGVGHLHQTLLELGAKSSIGIDLSPKMLIEAQNWSAERGLGERTRYIEGDFIILSKDIGPADICILDKVICCYPDANSLVHQSLAKSKKLYALTYPRNRWFTRLAVSIGAAFMWLIRSDFRPYVHDPEQIQTWINAAGYQKQFEEQTFFWLTQIFQFK